MRHYHLNELTDHRLGLTERRGAASRPGSNLVVKACRKWLPYVLTLVVFGVGWAWWQSGGSQRGSATGGASASAALGCPTNLDRLLALTSSQVSECDIALLNLVCTEGLPGAEKLNSQECLATLNRWTEHVRSETERHLYRFMANPREFESSEGYFRMLMMAVVLYEDFGVRYNPARISTPEAIDPNDHFFADSRDVFLHGLLGQPCNSLLSNPPHEPRLDKDGPLSLSLSPSKGERVPKAGEEAVQGFKAGTESSPQNPSAMNCNKRKTMSSVPTNLARLAVCLLLLLVWLQTACAYYDPGVQRWINRDPIHERGGLNLYSVVGDTPLNAVDRDGLVFNPGDNYQCVTDTNGQVICEHKPPDSSCGGLGNGCGEILHPPPGWQCTSMSQGFPVLQGPPLPKPPTWPPPALLPPVEPPIPCSICNIN